ncbi:hypothetical protein PPYR_07888 [Photinus pyralis]|uniref:Lipase domain-containing protein n=1 Tax=Photinus pyralis TaxID=7054 RepID=A0A1Y1LIP1_PHOPY|nr:hepatic triacylglycerol lipase-like [Photinus pyralis]KAB0800008.1 hypothetical protein PPYR_07888 [Photinus pyralis]
MARILLLVSSIFLCGKLGSSFMDIPVINLPEEIRDDLINIVTNPLKLIHNCDSSDTQEVQYLLYTRKNRDRPIKLNPQQPMEVEEGKPTILLIHGWISDSNFYNMPKIREGFLTKYDCNVIMIDWSKTSFKTYGHSVCALPVIAEEVARLLCKLDAYYGVPLELVHIIGHSLGGQMSGLIGQSTREVCQKSLGRITALDPAGPLFFGLPESKRLDPSDANFVQAIHTNGGVFGYLPKCADVDFFVNCGTYQHGCITISLLNITNVLVSDVTCSHSRSLDYLEESIYSTGFVGHSCKYCPVKCIADLFNSKSAVMGEHTAKDASGSFLVTTASSSPFAQKCTSYAFGVCL